MSIQLKNLVPVIFGSEDSEIFPVQLSEFVETEEGATVEFSLDTFEGSVLPEGIVLTTNGQITGSPVADSARFKPYECVVVAKTSKIDFIKIPVTFVIYQPIMIEDKEERLLAIYNVFEAFWEEFENESPLPDIASILERDVTPQDIYYMLGRFSTLIVWNADDPSTPGEGKIITLPGVSDKFNVYDFGQSLVATPKHLFDMQRGLKDAIITSKAVAEEVHKRKWNVDITGYDKMVSALWVEIQRINKKTPDFKIKVPNYDNTQLDRDLMLLKTI